MLGLVLCLAALASGPAGGRPAHIGCAGRDIRFRAADGVKLVAHRFGTGPVAVVLAHDDDGNLCTWVPFATQLAQHGYTAIAFDFRGYGESELRRGRGPPYSGPCDNKNQIAGRRPPTGRVFLPG